MEKGYYFSKALVVRAYRFVKSTKFPAARRVPMVFILYFFGRFPKPPVLLPPAIRLAQFFPVFHRGRMK
jgi:hypothetical protein